MLKVAWRTEGSTSSFFFFLFFFTFEFSDVSCARSKSQDLLNSQLDLSPCYLPTLQELRVTIRGMLPKTKSPHI